MLTELCLNNGRDLKNAKNIHYGSFVIKPDAHQLHLSEPLIADIEQAGFKILFRKEMYVTRNRLVLMYPEYVEDPEVFPAMENLFNLGPSTVLLVTSTGLIEAETVFDRIKKAKGKALEGGIRDKYILFYKNDLMASGLTGRELNNEVAKNRLHGPSSDDEHTWLLRALINRQDVLRIKEYDPNLYEHVAYKIGIW